MNNYKSHSGEAKSLHGEKEFNYIALHKHTKTLYLYMFHGEKDHWTKHSYKYFYKFDTLELFNAANAALI